MTADPTGHTTTAPPGPGGSAHDRGDHDHGDHPHEHSGSVHDHAAHGHDHGDHPHDHRGSAHDHGDHNGDHDGWAHDHGDHDHDHGDHPHDHLSAHGHGHGYAPETLPEPSGPGSVLVEIGGDVGAAIVTTPADLDGKEIEIRPEPGEWVGEHVAVRPRPLPDRTIHAAFFESLHAGSYRVRVRFGPVGAIEVPLEVTGGRVSQLSWPGL